MGLVTDASVPGKYPYHVVGGSGHRVGSFESLSDAKAYSELHPAWSVLTPRLIFHPYYRYDREMKQFDGAAVAVMGVGGGWRKMKTMRGHQREYACRFPNGEVYWCFADELFIPDGKDTE